LRGAAATLEPSSKTALMETVVCSKCGQRFAIQHDHALQNVEMAKKQAFWVSDQLVWDHIQERKHHGTMELPSLP
jgi:transcription elongation factor Elf1